MKTSSFMWFRFLIVVAVASTFLSLSAAQRLPSKNNNNRITPSSDEESNPHNGCERMMKDQQPPTKYTNETGLRGTGTRVVETNLNCENGFAGSYPCKDVNLASHISAQALNSAIGGATNTPDDNLADIWGWTHTVGTTTREFVIVCLRRGTAYVEITDPLNPIYLGAMKSNFASSSLWCDVKVYNDHAYIVSESYRQGIQVLNLTEKLLDATPNTEYFANAVYDELTSAHNIFINEDTGFGYIVGSRTCNGGLHMVNLADPQNIVFAGCYAYDGYTHDVQCVLYDGPDSAYVGKELCFACNEDTVSIIDVTNKRNPVMVSRNSYEGSSYTHQGWLTEDHKYFVFGDELDEILGCTTTVTYVLDVQNLNSPSAAIYSSPYTGAVDHNQYIHDGYIYQANYRAGLRILQASNYGNADLTEVGFFDIYPSDDFSQFNGAWSVYPFFPSKTIAISGIEQGLFLLRANDEFSPALPDPELEICYFGGGDDITTDPLGGFFDCFSSIVTTVVKGKGKTPMSMVEVGDEVLTETGSYGTVYAIDHRHTTKLTTFIQIHASPSGILLDEQKEEDQELPLELSSAHMVFLENSKNPVPASMVKVGDRMKTLDGSRTVVKLSVVTRVGLYNPLTVDGTIVANGIVSSTYSSVFSSSSTKNNNDGWIEVIGGYKFMTQQHFFDTILKPYKYLCTTIIFPIEMCKINNNNDSERVPIANFAVNVNAYILQQQNRLYKGISLSLIIMIVCALDVVSYMLPYLLVTSLAGLTWITLTKERNERMRKKLRERELLVANNSKE